MQGCFVVRGKNVCHTYVVRCRINTILPLKNTSASFCRPCSPCFFISNTILTFASGLLFIPAQLAVAGVSRYGRVGTGARRRGGVSASGMEVVGLYPVHVHLCDACIGGFLLVCGVSSDCLPDGGNGPGGLFNVGGQMGAVVLPGQSREDCGSTNPALTGGLSAHNQASSPV